MSDGTAIRVRNVSKKFAIYDTRWKQALALLGFLPKKFDNHTTKHVLHDLSFDIKKGERVAIIGANGAGKSTLLKLLIGGLQPTRGSIEIFGNAQALLSLETGLYEEFTGRENIKAYLSQLGFHGEELNTRIRKVIDFAELQEVIDRPVKTYSQGMAMRLMFSMSIIEQTDILLIDEVLSVGDAYFAQKSTNKIRETADQNNATLILVTHDLHAASAMCDRIIWLKQGQIEFDGDTLTAIKRYETAVREQAEVATRQRHIANLASKETSMRQPGITNIFAQIRTLNGAPPEADLPIEEVTLNLGDRCIARCVCASDNTHDNRLSGGAKIISNDSNWSEPIKIDDRHVRLFRKYGSIFHRAPVHFRLNDSIDYADFEKLNVTVTFKDTTNQPCIVELRPGHEEVCRRGALENTGTAIWQQQFVNFGKQLRDSTAKDDVIRHGTQAVSIRDVTFHNGNGVPAHSFVVGEDLHFSATFQINDPNFAQTPVFLVAFMRDGIHRTHRFIMNKEKISYKDGPAGEITATASPFLAGPGRYLINILIFNEGYFDTPSTNTYFSQSDRLLDSHSRAYELIVLPSNERHLNNDISFLHPVDWTVRRNT